MTLLRIKTKMEEKSYQRFNSSFTLEKMWSGYKEIYVHLNNNGGRK